MAAILRQIYIHTDSERQAGKHTDRKTNRDSSRHAERERNTGNHRDIHTH